MMSFAGTSPTCGVLKLPQQMWYRIWSSGSPRSAWFSASTRSCAHARYSLHRRGRDHEVVRPGQERVVDLQDQPCVEDRLVLDPQHVGDRVDELLLGRVRALRPADARDARRRDDRQEPGDDVDLRQPGLDVVDVALQLGLARVRERPDALPPAGALVLEALARHVLRVEVRELDHVLRLRHRRGVEVAGRPVLEAAHPVEDVRGPVDGLAELAVADDVDPGVGLVADDVDHRLAQHALVLGLIERPAVTARLEDAPELRRAHEAPHVRGQDAIGVVHGRSLPPPAPDRIGELRNLRGSRASSCCLRA